MSRRCLVAALSILVACSSADRRDRPPRPALANQPAPAPPADVVGLIAADVTSVMRSEAGEASIVEFLTRVLASPPTCWIELTRAIRVAYTFEQASGSSYFVFEGSLPRAEVERCAVAALGETMGLDLRHEGDRVVASSKLGTTYGAWRGSTLVVGSRASLDAALGPHDLALTTTWRARLAALRPGRIAIWRADLLFARLFGVATTHYQLTFTRLDKGPPPSFVGQLRIGYPSAADAGEAARRVRAGLLEPTLAAPAEVATAFRRMKVEIDGLDVVADFDEATFEGLSLELLQAWGARVAAPTATTAP